VIGTRPLVLDRPSHDRHGTGWPHTHARPRVAFPIFERSIASSNRSPVENRSQTGRLIYDIPAECVRVSNGSQSERAEQFRALHETTREMMAGETREAVADIAICAASDILGFSANAIHFYEDERGLVPVAATDRTREIIGDVPVFAEGRVSRGASTGPGRRRSSKTSTQIPTFTTRRRRFEVKSTSRSARTELSSRALKPRASSTRPNSRWDRCSPQISNRRSSKSNASRNCYDRTSVSRSSPASCHTISEIR